MEKLGAKTADVPALRPSHRSLRSTQQERRAWAYGSSHLPDASPPRRFAREQAPSSETAAALALHPTRRVPRSERQEHRAWRFSLICFFLLGF